MSNLVTVTIQERVTRRLIANREGETVHQQKANNRPVYEKMLLTQLPKMYSREEIVSVGDY